MVISISANGDELTVGDFTVCNPVKATLSEGTAVIQAKTCAGLIRPMSITGGTLKLVGGKLSFELDTRQAHAQPNFQPDAVVFNTFVGTLSRVGGGS